MSALQMTCEDCGQQYTSGVVGSWSWPAHKCPPGVNLEGLLREVLFSIDWSERDGPPADRWLGERVRKLHAPDLRAWADILAQQKKDAA